MVKVAPSILASDFGRLADEVRSVPNADWLHVDVMDGHFVPNITIGPDIVAALRRETELPLDVHLMIEEPIRYLDAFVQAGADRLTVHAEACRHLHSTLQAVQSLGIKAGVAYNPATGLDGIPHVLHMVDLVLIMTVNPGFGGQKFLPEMLPKVREAAELRASNGGRFELQVDGGITHETVGVVAQAGATVVVAGTAVFKSSEPRRAIEELRAAATP